MKSLKIFALCMFVLSFGQLDALGGVNLGNGTGRCSKSPREANGGEGDQCSHAELLDQGRNPMHESNGNPYGDLSLPTAEDDLSD